ncbi:hypothetical protein LINPERHAP2_LOCUS2745 [Linum perenne]
MHISRLRLIFTSRFSRSIDYTAEYVESSMRVCMIFVSRVGGMVIRMSHARHDAIKRKIRRLSQKRHLIIRSLARLRLHRRWRSLVPG